MKKDQGQLIFISGGVRSGKSSFAEALAYKIQDQTGENLTYIATSLRTDAEMEERIQHHQSLRRISGRKWRTYEISRNFARQIEGKDFSGIVLIDCVTVLLANELFIEVGPLDQLLERSRNLIRDLEEAILQLKNKVHTLILVSNEIQFEAHSEPFVQLYQWSLGRLHQAIVTLSTASFLVEASIPIQMKGIPLFSDN